MAKMTPDDLLALKIVQTEPPGNTEQKILHYFRRITANRFSRNHASYGL